MNKKQRAYKLLSDFILKEQHEFDEFLRNRNEYELNAYTIANLLSWEYE